MSRRVVALLGVIVLIPLLAVVGCSQPQPAAEQPKAAEPAKPAVDVSKLMHEQLARVTVMQEAVIRGDLEASVEPAKWIVDNLDSKGLPEGTSQIVADLKKSAGVVAEAKDLKNAATATAMVVSYCGTCHTAAKVTPAIAEPAKPAGSAAVASHMMEHQWATDLMYQGLVIPSEERWQKGLDAMKGSPLAAKDLPKDTKLTKEIVALEVRVHELAAKAKAATDIGTKVALYGDALAGCAGCHSLHGKTWGPGLPK